MLFLFAKRDATGPICYLWGQCRYLSFILDVALQDLLDFLLSLHYILKLLSVDY